MLKYVLKRFLLIIPTVLGVVTIVFFLTRLAPGDPARLLLGSRADKESVERVRKKLGLDKNIVIQYLIFLKNASRLDFGESISTGDDVMKEISSRFPATIELALLATFIATIAGIFLGVASATNQNSLIDLSSMVGALIGVSIPIFWLSLMLMLVFSIFFKILPTGGRINIRYDFTVITNFYVIDSVICLLKEGDPKYLISTIRHIILPACALATIPLAIIARMTRSSLLEELRRDYIRTARAKGLKERVIVYKHALKNALLPIITVIGIEFGYNLAGAVLTEKIFSWPGLGRWLYKSINARDFPAIQGGIIIIAFTFIVINLGVDLLYIKVNPKIHY